MKLPLTSLPTVRWALGRIAPITRFARHARAAQIRRTARPPGASLALLTVALVAVLGFSPAQAALGVTELPARADDGPITVFYPTDAPEQRWAPGGRMTLNVARDAAPAPGNGRLVIVSHGSGGSPWVHADLARALTEAGYVVAVPRHAGDNYLDDGTPGPESWERRPAEASRAIDTVAADPRFAAHLKLERVGVYGMSAGGHTALTMAGGRWSPSLFAEHCARHLADDFNACVGLATGLDGGWLDGVKVWLARSILELRFGSDGRLRTHSDPRIAAVVAAVPHAASFEPASLAYPRVPLALASARADTWLHPRFHSDAVLQVCAHCEHLSAAAQAGHGAYLSPMPTGFTGLAGRLLNDPPDFDRTTMAAMNARITAFFGRHLGGAIAQPGGAAAEASRSP